MFSWAALAVVAFAQETDTRKILVAFGDSISAGYGVSREQSYPAQLQKKIDMAGLKWRVVNMGISGDTTQGGVSRMGSAIKRMPSIVLIELGGNDGLRGMPVSVSKANIEKLIKGFQEIGAQVVLAGMSLPPNYGPKYISDFEAAYKDLAAKYKVTFIPFLLKDIVTKDMRYFQDDGIHPTAPGAAIVAETVFKAVRPLLK